MNRCLHEPLSRPLKPRSHLGISREYRREMGQRAYGILAEGKTLNHVSSEMGVPASTLREWRKTHPEFDRSIRDGEHRSQWEWVRQGRRESWKFEKGCDIVGYIRTGNFNTLSRHIHETLGLMDTFGGDDDAVPWDVISGMLLLRFDPVKLERMTHEEVQTLASLLVRAWFGRLTV